MRDPLDASKAKVQWAEKHFSDFKDIVFDRSTGVDTRKTTVVHYGVQRRPHIGRRGFAPPLECRLAFGDAVHQLRSSLDHLVCDLALRPAKPNSETPPESSRLEFPIHKARHDFEANWRVSRGVFERLIGRSELEAIIDAQPYNRTPHSPQADPLWLLRELDNIDKHRTILVIDPRVLTKYLDSEGQLKVIKQPYIPAADGVFVELSDSPTGADVQERSLVVVLAETGLSCDNVQVIAVWRQMVSAVKHTIASFERFF